MVTCKCPYTFPNVYFGMIPRRYKLFQFNHLPKDFEQPMIKISIATSIDRIVNVDTDQNTFN